MGTAATSGDPMYAFLDATKDLKPASTPVPFRSTSSRRANLQDRFWRHVD